MQLELKQLPKEMCGSARNVARGFAVCQMMYWHRCTLNNPSYIVDRNYTQEILVGLNDN